jgi:hypothetical protein
MTKFLLFCLCAVISFFNLRLTAEEIPLMTEYRVDTMWATAYQVTVKLTNQTNHPTEEWMASFTLPLENMLSAHVSSGEFSTNGENVTVKNLTSNGAISPNSSVTFNMIINMPQSGKTVIDHLVAIGYSSIAAPPESGLSQPTLHPISSSTTKDYVVSWDRVANATAYYLEVDDNINFTDPTILIQGDVNSVTFTNQPAGTYFYRLSAANASKQSSYSNVEQITVAEPNSIVTLLATYTVDTVWATAFQSTVTITNNTTVPVKKWTATFSLPENFELSSHNYSGTLSSAGKNITVESNASNATMAVNASVTFSMLITKPRSAVSRISNLQASGYANSTLPIPIPSAPVLEVKATSANSYTVSWASVGNLASYTLEEDSDSNFIMPSTSQGNILAQSFTNKPSGTYYYRAFATNSSGDSAYSNIVSITVANDNPIPPRDTIEYSVWYIDWTSWFDNHQFVIPCCVNMVNIFVGELTYAADGKPTMGGFGTFTLPQMKEFVQFLAAQEPPIQAKVSIGGSGGMYDHTWDKLTSANISNFAQGMVDFCHQLGLVGVDFDYEAFASTEQEILVGRLIKEFKTLDPNLQTSLCSNAGFGPYFPWQQSVKNILDASMISPGNCALDRFYIMSYYNSMIDEINWIVGADGNGGWSNWLETNYGFSRARISVGIDDFDAHAYDPDAFRAWAANEGFSVAHWAFDPAHPR